jgi:hypothetical protein
MLEKSRYFFWAIMTPFGMVGARVPVILKSVFRVIDWARILAYVTGTVDQELLARNEYLAAENRILKAQLKVRAGQGVAMQCARDTQYL